MDNDGHRYTFGAPKGGWPTFSNDPMRDLVRESERLGLYDDRYPWDTPVRPVILVDMDGPLAGFDQAFYELCDRLGFEMNSTLETQTERYATGHVVIPAERKFARAIVDSPGWFIRLPVVEGAVEGLNALAEVAEVWICTKPLEVNPTCRDEKGAWLKDHFGSEWEKRMIIAPDKSLVRGAILLDDAPFPEWFERASWNPVVYPTSWNGEGTAWQGLPRWTWGDPIDSLLQECANAV